MQNYLDGVVMVAMVLVGVGLALTVVMCVMYIFAWRYGWCGPEKAKEERAAEPRRNSAIACVCVWVLAFLFAVSIGVASYATGSMGRFVADGVDTLNGLDSALGKGIDATDSSEDSANETQWLAMDTTVKLQKLAASSGYGPVYQFSNASMKLSTASGGARDLEEGNKEALESLRGSIDDASNGATGARREQAAGAWSGLAISLLFAISLAASTLRYGFCAPVNKFCNGFGLFFHLGLWTFAGAYLAIALVAADFCTTPDDTGFRLIRSAETLDSNKMENTSLAIGSADYYLIQCEADTPSSSPDANAPGVFGTASQAALLLDQVVTGSNYLVANLSSVRSTLRPLAPEDFDAAMYAATNLSASSISANTSAWNVLPTVGCEAVRPLWEEALRAVCADAIDGGFFPLFVGSFAAALLLSLILLFSIPICAFHPSEMNGNILENLANPAEASRRPRPQGRGRAIPDPYGTVSTSNPINSALDDENAHLASQSSRTIEIPEWGGSLGASTQQQNASVSSWAKQQEESDTRKHRVGKVRSKA